MSLDALERARRAAWKAQELFLAPSPEALDQATEFWPDVEAALRETLSHPHDPDAARRIKALEHARQLGAEIARARLLLDQAAAFYGGWVQLRNLLEAGYGAQGSPVEPLTSGRTLAEV